ncbi:structure-specific endonuclease subunit slx1 isoform X2 [Lingula anatina]|uniref:Structure-specific endonuclease subunit SLX1 homolog n=1 Tax=Lingula anatina TaxID=7574 RepID=A0A1S3HK36_LINAN|nr:structure-specific endonuclease subunit slx1 isoform X2 [Lingula anatina]|eukprot:XP_013386382.1 structure-specific endonuclease subunit slx1 isoform X2 [Lingula anatina]
MAAGALDKAHEIENFYGCYLLYSLNPKCKGRTYIGFTVDPNRRIKQHNAGKQAGGAWRTSGRGPWEMVLIIHGFPNEISALRFEWAWQHPEVSRRLKHIVKRRKAEHGYKHKFRIACEMLRVGPWCRLPLTIRWLKQEYTLDFPPDLTPPVHMPIVYGPVKSVKVKNKTKGKRTKTTDTETERSGDDDSDDFAQLLQPSSKHPRCAVCSERFVGEDDRLKCIQPNCVMQAHTICLAKVFLQQGAVKAMILPVNGQCPKCHQDVLWGDLVRLKRGCYQNIEEAASEESEDHWANQLTQA